jgi:hypothetical protein
MRRHSEPKFFVSRQRYWGVEDDSAHVVEVAMGGLDYANPDMLSVAFKKLGEGKEYNDPKEAVEAAIAVCDAWRASGEPHAAVALGATGGNTLPFEPQDYDTIRHKAQQLYDKLPKCTQCNEVLGKNTFTHDFAVDEEEYCSERCAEKAYNTLQAEDSLVSDDVPDPSDKGVDVAFSERTHGND